MFKEGSGNLGTRRKKIVKLYEELEKLLQDEIDSEEGEKQDNDTLDPKKEEGESNHRAPNLNEV